MSKELREQFSKETGLDNWEQPTNYFEWLETKLITAAQQNKELMDEVKEFLKTILSSYKVVNNDTDYETVWRSMVFKADKLFSKLSNH